MAEMRTKMRTVQGLGAAHAGTGHFWLQRLTAVANIPLTLFFVGLLAALDGAGFGETRGALSNPWVALPLLLALVSILVHMRLGMQVIIEDYVHGELSRLALLMLNSFFAIAVGAACAFAIFKLAFTGAAA